MNHRSKHKNFSKIKNGYYLHDFGIGKAFLEMTPEALNRKAKFDTLKFIKM